MCAMNYPSSYWITCFWKKFKILGLQDPEEYLGDEQSKDFENGWAGLLEERQVSEDELEEADERTLKDELREIMGLPPIEEMIPDHKVDLPKRLSKEMKLAGMWTVISTDLSEKKLRKCLEKIERERIRFEREKGCKPYLLRLVLLNWRARVKSTIPPCC